MTTLKDFKKSITNLSDAELIDLHKALRQSRRTYTSKDEKKAGGRQEMQFKKLKTLFASMSKEDVEKILNAEKKNASEIK